MGCMNSQDAGFHKRTFVTWGVVALSAAGAVGASVLAYNDTAQDYSTTTDSAPPIGGISDNTWTTTSTTTPRGPNQNGTHLASGSGGTHTRSRGS